jgi:hypothetical protein
VRRLFAWTAGLVGITALARVLARRQRRAEAESRLPAAAPDPAEELRRKLSATRSSEPATGDEPPPAGDAGRSETIDERRARVHAKAQEAIEAMQGPAE